MFLRWLSHKEPIDIILTAFISAGLTTAVLVALLVY